MIKKFFSGWFQKYRIYKRRKTRARKPVCQEMLGRRLSYCSRARTPEFVTAE